LKSSQTLIEIGKQFTATAPNDTMRILSLSIDALTEARDELSRQNTNESPDTASNNDYTAALEDELNLWMSEETIINRSKNGMAELAARLNAALQKQHCA